ncbi:MAG: hypothetical protein SO011_00210 [Prevotella sp.]|nr:hypothetical protein [Prevotella sp.]
MDHSSSICSPRPKDLKEGFPVHYFPSDFRLGDPLLPIRQEDVRLLQALRQRIDGADR